MSFFYERERTWRDAVREKFAVVWFKAKLRMGWL
jgi:hypothetical protein